METRTKFSSISSSTSIASMKLIPIDIWVKITSTFSIKSLITLSSVNKFFLALITDPAFVSAHLRRPNSGNRLLTYVSWSHGAVFAIMDRDLGFIDRVNRVIKPGSKVVHWDEVVCSLDGLVVLSKPKNMTATLWNPSMRQHRRLELQKPDTEHYFGIGYRFDSLYNNDYKIVALHASQDEAWLYTVRTKSWTPITDRRFHDHDKKTYTYSMNLSLKHTTVWIESIQNIRSPLSKRLLLFHFETETFRYASLPSPVNWNASHRRLALLDGGSTVGAWWTDAKGEVSVWGLDTNTMDWTERYKLRLKRINLIVVDLKVEDRSMFVEKDGKLVWRYWRENGWLGFVAFSFDIKRKIYLEESVTSIGLHCLDVYHESLVTIN